MISLIFVLAALIFLGCPVFLVIGALALIAFRSVGLDSSLIMVELYRLATLPALIAIPLFTFSGYLLAKSKAPQRLLNLANAFFGWIPGGVAIVTLVSCALFTAFTGASGVTIIALGGLLYPMLIKEEYSEKFVLGLLTTTGSLGLLFPPSLPIILYGLIAKVSIDKLFLASLVPGIFLIVVLSFYGFLQGTKNFKKPQPFSYKRLLGAVKEAGWEIPLPFLIIGGIYGGIFTATEASSVMAFYVVVAEVFIYKDISLKDFPTIIVESMVLVGAIMVVMGLSLGLTNYLIDEQIPMRMFEWIHRFIESKTIFLIFLNIFLLIMNMIEMFSAIIIVVPLIVPVAIQYGIDPIHLGVIFLLNLEIGYMTAPFGLNLFLSSLRFGKPVTQIYRATLPFWLILMVVLVCITYIPGISLFFVK
ncbi:MAG: C4-dicarboxylate ABC transporter [Elusimicrobia bacterium RIFCSPLOWO2_02_FULL_39_32]|nr:MAG: C4-dicarboxylate ABC transporter [Elusimicrobia bacterium RIFCSPHIGHO2_02_FULL_39_36]OGR92381.1 MAG: C4-dicarboxylate ABC transporter [Elusimicrobia bacterium RIFCSPLOWO2_02_FULL_39_32]OGR98924.1 MAG: C4-dicarboxylate ABC transporter [Elusimicrobia bacterium RIFCSPLOWO2_12_FULL_39_28]